MKLGAVENVVLGVTEAGDMVDTTKTETTQGMKMLSAAPELLHPKEMKGKEGGFLKGRGLVDPMDLTVVFAVVVLVMKKEGMVTAHVEHTHVTVGPGVEMNSSVREQAVEIGAVSQRKLPQLLRKCGRN